MSLARQDVLEYRKVVITGDELRGWETEEAAYGRLEMLLNLMPQTGVYWIGGDLGYWRAERAIVCRSLAGEVL